MEDCSLECKKARSLGNSRTVVHSTVVLDSKKAHSLECKMHKMKECAVRFQSKQPSPWQE